MSLGIHLLSASHPRCVAVVGLGLVGRPISNVIALQSATTHSLEKSISDWSSSNKLIKELSDYCSLHRIRRLDLVWAAGQAGFFAKQGQLEREVSFFESVVQRLNDKKDINLSVSMISSAGGIYEFSGVVKSVDDTSAHRPYALAKLRQEKVLQSLGITSRVYRASTVYGYGGNRVGLIATMLRSARFRSPMSIFANLNTLRDYIYNYDLAKLIVDDLLFDAESGVRIAASGRALSIASVVQTVQQITNRRVLATFRPSTDNDTSIVFDPRVVAEQRSQTSFEEGIRLVNRTLFS